MKIIRDGEPCDHIGCLSHISHPCEGCGRIAGKGEVLKYNLYDADSNCKHEIIDSWNGVKCSNCGGWFCY